MEIAGKNSKLKNPRKNSKLKKKPQNSSEKLKTQAKNSRIRHFFVPYMPKKWPKNQPEVAVRKNSERKRLVS